MKFLPFCFGISSIVSYSLIDNSRAIAQISIDTTLGSENSRIERVRGDGNTTDIITGGALRDTNLFHSFQEFSVTTGTTAFFDNPINIKNIIGRVTGSSSSRIDGLIRANGNANLFLVNPNGIIFGPNARLDIGGSFFGSAVSGIKFDNGFIYETQNPQVPPLLTINIPVGFSSAVRPGSILASRSELQVKSGRTLALIGDRILIEGGILRADNGQIALIGTANDSEISLQPQNGVFNFGFTRSNSLGDISLSDRTILETSGEGGGAIDLYAQNVKIFERSRVVSDTFGDLNGKEITIFASNFSLNDSSFIGTATFGNGKSGDINIQVFENTQISGVGRLQPVFIFGSLQGKRQIADRENGGIFTGTGNSGNAGNIAIRTRTLTLLNGSAISSASLGRGRGGDIDLIASDSVELYRSGLSSDSVVPGVPLTDSNQVPTGLSTRGFLAGDAGNITLKTGRLMIRDGATISASTTSDGNAGSISLRVSDSIEMKEFSAGQPLPSIVSSVSVGGTGTGGTINLETPRLIIRDGGTVFTMSGTFTYSGLNPSGERRGTVEVSGIIPFGGRAGNINVNASASVEMSGNVANGSFPSTLNTRTFSSESAGEIRVSAPDLIIRDGARLTVDSIGSGNSGTIRINARSIFLDNRGGITASSVRENSSGGFINIYTDTLRANDSNISASTQRGRAGNLTIQATEAILLNGTGGLSVEATGGGTAGTLNVETRRMNVAGGATVSVSSTSGRAGNLKIIADTLSLDRGTISAETARSGANLFLQLSNLVRLENQSLISATAEGDADGGNITIETPFAIAFPQTGFNGSDIVARADRGNGGNITINASGVFGIAKNQAIPGNQSNDIDASSRTGAPGQVDLKTTLDPNQNTIQLAETIVDPATLISQNSCRRRGGSQFTITGRGGLPANVSDDLGDTATEARLIEPAPMTTGKTTEENETRNTLVPSSESSDNKVSPAIVPVRGWISNDRGEVVLVSYDPLIIGPSRSDTEIPNCPLP